MKPISSLGVGACTDNIPTKKVLSLKTRLTLSFPESQMINGAVKDNDKALILMIKQEKYLLHRVCPAQRLDVCSRGCWLCTEPKEQAKKGEEMCKVAGRKKGWRVLFMRYEKEHGGGGVGGNVKYPWVCAQERKRIYFIFYLCKGRWELREVVWD